MHNTVASSSFLKTFRGERAIGIEVGRSIRDV